MPWIDPSLLPAFATEATTAHRLYTAPDAWLERFGDDLLLSHKSPEALTRLRTEIPTWTKTHQVSWTRLYGKFLPRQSEERLAPLLLEGDPALSPLTTVLERGLRYHLDFSAGYSVGLFMDQRHNRSHLRELQPKRVLNLFAYTCAFSVTAAHVGAQTLSVDLSKKSLQRGEANFLANHQSLDGHRFFADDTLTVLPRLYRKQETFDVIILDPPTFSRGEKGRAFRVEHDLPSLLEQCLELLTPKGHLLVSTNCSKLTVRDLEHMGKNALKVAQRQAVFHQTPALPDLPYGAATTLWLHLK